LRTTEHSLQYHLPVNNTTNINTNVNFIYAHARCVWARGRTRNLSVGWRGRRTRSGTTLPDTGGKYETCDE
jgi:hypothetical protein